MSRDLSLDEINAIALALELLPLQTFVMTATTAFTLMAQCQLALRHPHNTGLSSEVTRQWVEAAARYLDAQVPGTYDLVQQGYDPRHDV